jgi:beta-glucosidase/6-phospho-beta-glucosidase/beta-galactosidase
MSQPSRTEPQAPQRADFASDFLWGCATSSYQIEGAAHEDGRVESIWDRFAATPGRIRDGSSGEVACDHYHRWPEDLDIGRDLGLNAYRFSIAWPRIFSGVGAKPNQKGLDFYSRLVDGMLERGLQPWATLYHGLRYRWFLDPLYGRGYPADTLEQVGANAPTVLAGDLEAIAVPTDFLGVNYYFPETIADDPGHAPLDARVLAPSGDQITGMGWPVEPQGMAELLARVENDYHPGPIYVTENGSCYEDTVSPDGSVHDTERRRYLMRHLGALRQAIGDGVPVQGYFAWSLVDNFEWAEGYQKRFGLVHIDYTTQQRRLKDSAKWYRAFLKPE